MQLSYRRWERRDATDRGAFGAPALRWCRALRQFNPRVTDARYCWVDGGNTTAVLVEGEPGFNDRNAEPDTELMQATFGMYDLARRIQDELWTDARVGARACEIAGRPSGVLVREAADLCHACGGSSENVVCSVRGGTGRIRPARR